jgi:hypothetical protein
MPVNEVNEAGIIFRGVTGIRGKLTFEMQCLPRFDYARKMPVVLSATDKASVIFSDGNPDNELRLSGICSAEGRGRSRFRIICA